MQRYRFFHYRIALVDSKILFCKFNDFKACIMSLSATHTYIVANMYVYKFNFTILPSTCQSESFTELTFKSYITVELEYEGNLNRGIKFACIATVCVP